MKVYELIARLLDEPMDAEISLCTDYDKEEVEDYGNVRVVNRGVIFDIDEIERWTNDRVNINFTDWRADNKTDRLQGKWIEADVVDIEDTCIEEVQTLKCSVCGRIQTKPYMYYVDCDNFCPNCGADMRGEDDESIDLQ